MKYTDWNIVETADGHYFAYRPASDERSPVREALVDTLHDISNTDGVTGFLRRLWWAIGGAQ